MKVLGVREAAAAIRASVSLQHMDPQHQHELRFLKDVASELGLDHSAEVLTHIADLLHRHDVAPRAMQEYPKHVKNVHTGVEGVVDSAEQEAEFCAAPPVVEAVESDPASPAVET